MSQCTNSYKDIFFCILHFLFHDSQRKGETAHKLISLLGNNYTITAHSWTHSVNRHLVTGLAHMKTPSMCRHLSLADTFSGLTRGSTNIIALCCTHTINNDQFTLVVL